MNKVKFFSWDNLFATLVWLLVLLFIPILTNLDFISPIQSAIGDICPSDIAFSKLQDQNVIPVDTNIVIVNIGTLDRKGIAAEIDYLKQFNPKVIGIDAFFRKTKTKEQDSALSCSIQSVPNIVLVSQLKSYNEAKDSFDTLQKSNDLFAKTTCSGFANFALDENKFRTVRIFSPKERVGDSTEYAFPANVVKLYNQKAFNNLIARSKTPEIINYRRNLPKYFIIDVNDIINHNFSDSLLNRKINGKIVLMGYLGNDTSKLMTEDVFFTPLNERFIGKSRPDMYGVVIHANIISQILENKYINSVPDKYSPWIIILIIYLNMFIFSWISKKYQDWYETFSLVFILFQLFVYFLLIVYAQTILQLSLNIDNIFIAVLLTATAFEIYTETVKPFFIGFKNKVFKNKNNIVSSR